MLFTAAAAMACDGLPLPSRVWASPAHGLDLRFATHSDLWQWGIRMGLPISHWHSQHYTRDEVPKVLTNTYGDWRGVRVWLSCCEPTTDTPPEFLPPEVVAA